jgi:hypothetical protein
MITPQRRRSAATHVTDLKDVVHTLWMIAKLLVCTSVETIVDWGLMTNGT